MLSAMLKAGARPLLYSSAPDGNRVTLTGRLHGFTSAAFRVSK